MSRPMGLVGAGVLLLATVGCSMDSFYVTLTGSQRKEQTVVGTPTLVARNLQMALSDKHCTSELVWNGDEARISGQMPGGKKFAFVLQRQKSDYGERTVVIFEGDKDCDDFLWQGVIQILVNGVRVPPAPAPRPGFPDSNNTVGQPPIQPAGGVQPPFPPMGGSR